MRGYSIADLKRMCVFKISEKEPSYKCKLCKGFGLYYCLKEMYYKECKYYLTLGEFEEIKRKKIRWLLYKKK